MNSIDSGLSSFIDTDSCDTMWVMNSSLSPQSGAAWLTVMGESDPSLAPALARSLAEQVSQLRSSGKFSEGDQATIQRLSFSVTREGFKTTPERMEMLRRLCQLYSADVRPQPPTSHRRIIGPVIVLAKRILQPVVQGLLGQFLKNQSDFNATTISLLTDLCNEGDSAERR
jgi:hypothetical protein